MSIASNWFMYFKNLMTQGLSKDNSFLRIKHCPNEVFLSIDRILLTQFSYKQMAGISDKTIKHYC